jgi:uncharacterized RDD family membrane protein YckC
VTSQAPRCPECGADPRTGLPTTLRRGTDRVRVREGVGRRGLAMAIDCLLLLGAFYVVMLAVFLFLAGKGEFKAFSPRGQPPVVSEGSSPSNLPYWLAFLVIVFLYFWICEGVWGRTAGKRFIGLRVVNAEGAKVSLMAALVRTLLRPIDWLPALYLLGAVLVWVTPRDQRLGDLAARTVVVRVRVVPLERLDDPRLGAVPWPGETGD